MAVIRNLLLSLLIACLLLSAIAVVYSRYQFRVLFVETQKMESILDEYEVEWGQLQLELTMLTEEHRVESEARNRLQLTFPSQNNIIYLKP